MEILVSAVTDVRKNRKYMGSVLQLEATTLVSLTDSS
jgi:hypothetical protein